MQQKIDEWVQQFLTFEWTWTLLKNVLSILATIIVCYLVYKIVVFFLTRYVKFIKGEKNIKRARTINRLIRSLMRYIFVTIATIFSLQFIGVDTATLFAGAGVIGIVLGFAFQDLLKDIVAGFFMIIEKSINVDDLVTIDGTTGTVTNVGIKTTTFIAYTGEKIVINNRDISKIINYSLADYTITINQIALHPTTDLTRFITLFNQAVENFKTTYPEVITIPQVMGIDRFELKGYVVQIDTKVRALSQFAFRRKLNAFLVSFCLENGFDMTLHVVDEKSSSSEGENDERTRI